MIFQNFKVSRLDEKHLDRNNIEMGFLTLPKFVQIEREIKLIILDSLGKLTLLINQLQNFYNGGNNN